ncbi:hypothetical protein [Paenibacillus sp. CAA11]|uniref:hypothetical protein n=1 Tax=Paenibacillus sp. CAA11 TaxID=1532905 RepID=UPI00131F4312|nr:hypothetical protein [Paenibacillus sp. CAA11]
MRTELGWRFGLEGHKPLPENGQKGDARMTISDYTVALAQVSRTAELVKMEDTES